MTNKVNVEFYTNQISKAYLTFDFSKEDRLRYLIVSSFLSTIVRLQNLDWRLENSLNKFFFILFNTLILFSSTLAMAI